MKVYNYKNTTEVCLDTTGTVPVTSIIQEYMDSGIGLDREGVTLIFNPGTYLLDDSLEFRTNNINLISANKAYGYAENGGDPNEASVVFKWISGKVGITNIAKDQQINPSSVSQSNGIATVTAVNHGLSNGMYVKIEGANEEEYNKNTVIKNVTSDTFDYNVDVSSPSIATGSIAIYTTKINNFCSIDGIYLDGNNVLEDNIEFGGKIDLIDVSSVRGKRGARGAHLVNSSKIIGGIYDNCSEYGILIDGYDSSLYSFRDLRVGANGKAGCKLTMGRSVGIDNCNFEGNLGYGLHLFTEVATIDPTDHRYLSGIQINNCHFESNGNSNPTNDQYNLVIDGTEIAGNLWTPTRIILNNCESSHSLSTSRFLHSIRSNELEINSCKGNANGDSANLVILEDDAVNTTFYNYEDSANQQTDLSVQGTNTVDIRRSLDGKYLHRGVFKTSGDVYVGDKLAIGNIQVAENPGYVIGKVEIFNSSDGSSAGYIPIYDQIIT